MRLLIASLAFWLALGFCATAQDAKQLRLLAEAYGTYFSRVEAPQEVLDQLDASGTHKEATAFIKECIRKKGKLLEGVYLQRPSEKVLRDLWLVKQLDMEEHTGREARHPLRVLDSLSTVEPDYYNLVMDYYLMLFAKASNQYTHKQFDKMNFELGDLGLDQTEKEIFFLSCMYHYRRKFLTAWDESPSEEVDWKEIKRRVNRIPTFDSKPYYMFNGFVGNDRLYQIFSDVPYATSYYHTFMNAYYDVLIKNFIAYVRMDSDTYAINDLKYNSWLNAPSFFKYSSDQGFLYYISRADHNP